MSLGYRTAGAPPAPGTSTDLPPGFLSREEKSQVQRHKKNTGRFKIAIGALILLVCVGVTLVLTKKSSEPKTIADVKEGECFNGDPDDLSIVDCGQPHTRELFKVLPSSAAADAAYPGEDALRTEQGNSCSLELVAYYGAGVDVATGAGVQLFPVVPSEQQWTDKVRDSFCLAGPSNNRPVTGSIKGAGAAGAAPAGGATTTAPPAAGG
jgi:hypothetical protein